nr:transposase (putative), gypsy type [Tanacetum cinerariifolium]
MGRDTIQLENAVSTISQEYLLEFTSDYGIPESLHPKVPGPEDPIVEFPEGWISFSKRPGKNTPQCYTKPLDSLKNWNNRFFWVDDRVFPTVANWRTSAPKDQMPPFGSYSTADVTSLNTRRTSIQKQPKALLCLVGLSRRYFLGDDVYPTFLYDDDRDMDLFSLISAPNPAKVKTETRPRAAHEVPLLTATANRVIDMEDMTGASGSSGTPSTIEKSPLDFSNEDPPPLITESIGAEEQGKCTTQGAEEGSCHLPPPQSTLGEKSLAFMGIGTGTTIFAPTTQEILVHTEGVSDLDPLSYAKPRPAPEQDVAQSSRKAVVTEDPNSEKSISFNSMAGSQEVYISREALLEAEVDMKGAAEAKNVELAKELKSLRIMGEERIKAAFKEFKKYEDDRVSSRCAEMNARLDALSIDFDEELYPHMLTTIASRRWIIGHDLRLAVIKCAESTELRQIFADVVSAGIAKGMSEGLKHGVEHGKAKVDLAAIKAYDPEADTKYVATLHALKDLKYPLVDQLEKLKDAPIDLKIPVYPEVRNPKDPWSFKDEILLEDAIAANVSRVEKKKKCQVVCRTHGVSSAYHARSDGVPISVPTVAPQGLSILLADAATQTEIIKDEASSRLIRSKSLPPLYILDWP